MASAGLGAQQPWMRADSRHGLWPQLKVAGGGVAAAMEWP